MRDRILAAIALLAAASAALFVVVAALDNIGGLVVALLGAAVLVGAGWAAVSRRGTGRAVALLASACGLALLLASIGIADVVWWRAVTERVLRAWLAYVGADSYGRACDQRVDGVTRHSLGACPARRTGARTRAVLGLHGGGH